MKARRRDCSGTKLRMVARGASHTHRMLRSRLAFLAVATVALDAVASVLMYAFEHTRPAGCRDSTASTSSTRSCATAAARGRGVEPGRRPIGRPRARGPAS